MSLQKRPWHSALTLGVAATLALAACSSSDSPPESEPTDGTSSEAPAGGPVTGGTLVYLEHQAHSNLYPPTAGFYPNGGIVNNITDRLVYQNPETLEFEPWIATSWEVNEDATEYTFTIRDDVTFSDGTPLDAEVVAKNFDLYGLGDPDRALTISEAINNYASSEVVDATTVTFSFSAPAPGFLQATSTINSGLLSSETLDLTFEEFGAGNSTAIVGSGPFVITGEELGTSLQFEAREDYAWAPPSLENQGRAYLDGIDLQVTPEDSVRVGALLAGQADYIRYVEAQDEEQVDAAGFVIYAPQTNGVNNSLSLRFSNEILSDLNVRQALIAGIDRQDVVDTIYTDNYPLATSALSSGALGYRDQSEHLAYDPDAAIALLEESGWTVGSDGIREKDGVPLSLVVNEAAPQPRSFEALTLISQQLREIGVDLQILRADAGTYAQAILDADQVQIYHSMVARADLDVIKSQYYSANRNALLNRNPADSTIADPELETLLENVASEPDADQRIENSGLVQDYLAENAYVIPLFEEPQVYGTATDVHGVGFESVARPSFYQVWLDRWRAGRHRKEGDLMSYYVQRGGQAVLVLFAAFTLAFVLLQWMPGDAIMIKFENPELGLSPEQIAELRITYGVDANPIIQYVHALLGFVQGDFGYSIQNGTPVWDVLAEVVPSTLALASLGFVGAVVLAFSVAFLSSFTSFAWIRTALRSLPSLFISVPVFWLGIMLIQIFSFRLGLVPVINPGPLQGLILPVIALAVPISAPLAQILARGIDEVYTQPFVSVVQAKGASRQWVLWRNVLKNAVLPTLTMAGILFGELIGGAVVTETVFARAGLGRVTEQAVANQDVPVLQAVVLVAALAFVLINLVVDLLYPVVDPRLRTAVRTA